jgi:RimJ/RimL family protein N-acetyltransferase
MIGTEIPRILAELLDPQSWQEPYYSVFNEENDLVGFFVFKQDGQTVEVGLGLRQDLTGQGLGRAYLNAGLAFGQEHFSVGAWSLSVATFNTRAIRLYEHAGFTRSTRFFITPMAESMNSCGWVDQCNKQEGNICLPPITQSAGEPLSW